MWNDIENVIMGNEHSQATTGIKEESPSPYNSHSAGPRQGMQRSRKDSLPDRHVHQTVQAIMGKSTGPGDDSPFQDLPRSKIKLITN